MAHDDVDFSAQRAWFLERLPLGASIWSSTKADFGAHIVVVGEVDAVVGRRQHGGLWAGGLHATPSKQMPVVLEKLWDALIPGGVLCMSFDIDGGEHLIRGEHIVDWMAALPALGPIEIWEVEHSSQGSPQQWLHVRAVRQPKLVTGGKGNPFLPQLRTAIRDAVEIDLAVAFIKTTGLRLLLPDLQEALDRDAVQLRVVTSDYLDLTDPEALRLLVLLQQRGAVVRVYEAAGGSFHMKAYLFAHHRDVDGEDNVRGTAFIGSSNISRQALTDGLEWNYRVEYPADDGFLEARSRFDELFDHPKTVPLTDEWIDSYQARRLVATFVAEPGADEIEAPALPSSVQQLALQALHDTRRAGFRRGLVVLATGLGKTWLAAFDAEQTRAKRVLFVAHREEILQQAAATFIRIRPHASVGFFIGQQRDADVDVLCASVQTLGKDAHLQTFAADHFDYIVVDEFHHAAAPTYQRLLQHFTPKFLLGLTATPDRTDQSDILSLCDDNLVFTRTLFEGVTEKLLVPFHYFGIDDDTVDYREIPWRNGRFDPSELSNKLTTIERARHALKTWLEHHQRRTLAFCVSTRHADFMAEQFRRAGVRAVAVYGGSTVGRADALDQLRQGDVDVVFSVDLFNEGVDLPLIDTVMMLRPTESKILFLQQLGRGLRRAAGKEHLVVLDFIGNHASFLHKPQALFGLGGSYRELAAFAREAAAGTLTLPEGCTVNYDLALLDFLRDLDADNSCAEYEALKATFGRRPSLLEFYRGGASVQRMRQQHGGWFQLVKEQNDLSSDELNAFDVGQTLLNDIESMPLASSEPIVFLKAFDELDGWRTPPTIDALAARSWQVLARRPRLRGDLPGGFDIGDDENNSRWRTYWREHEVTSWTTRNRTKRAHFKLEADAIVFTGAMPLLTKSAFSTLANELIDYRFASYEARRATDETSATNIVARSEAVAVPVYVDVDDAIANRPPLKLHDVVAAASHRATDVFLLDLSAREIRSVLLMERTNRVDMLKNGDVCLDERQGVLRVDDSSGARRFLRDGGKTITTADVAVVARQLEDLGPLALRVGERFMREDIAPLFGEVFNTGNWNSGHISLPRHQTVLLVTLSKQGKQEDHRYHDRWSDDRRRFHWQSQRTTTPINKKGREIVRQEEQGTSIHLFVREQKVEAGKGAAFVYAGRARYREHTGSNPMNVTFDLLD